MGEAEDFIRLIAEYQLSYGNELQAKVNRLDGIIGSRHWLSVGSYKENLLKSLLRNRMPKKYEVGTGFVMTRRATERVISRQIDILIWDAESHSPLFRDGDFVIVPPEACMAAIEVKSTLTAKTLREALQNLDSLSAFLPEHNAMQKKVLNRSIFAFELGEGLEFPAKIWNGLHAAYSKSTILPLAERLEEWSPHSAWQHRWITSIAILGQGVINVDTWLLNDSSQVVYVASRANPNEDLVDAYGFLEGTLLLELTLGYEKHFADKLRPGFTNLTFANRLTMVSGQCYMPVSQHKIVTVGRFSGTENEEWAGRAYYARKPVSRKKNRLPNAK